MLSRRPITSFSPFFFALLTPYFCFAFTSSPAIHIFLARPYRFLVISLRPVSCTPGGPIITFTFTSTDIIKGHKDYFQYTNVVCPCSSITKGEAFVLTVLLRLTF